MKENILTAQQEKIYKQLLNGYKIVVNAEECKYILVDSAYNHVSNLATKTYQAFKRQNLIGEETTGIYKVAPTMLERAMTVIDDYLNAGSKEERHKASVRAKELYKEYYGVEYKNRRDR